MSRPLFALTAGLLCSLGLPAQGQSAGPQEGAGDAAVASAMAQAEANRPVEADGLEVIKAGPGQALRSRFLAENPDARQHAFDLSTSAAGSAGAALRLTSVWAGRGGTLVQITGLPRPGKPNSAVMRHDTLALRAAGPTAKSARLLEFAGAQELRDPRGGSAIVVKEGDTVYLLFEPIDDYRPFRLQHALDGGGVHDYFDTLDPRWRDRYDDAYRAATSPEKMKDFIVAFARNDPDNRVREVFVRLIGLMRQQNTFEGYYNAYLLLQEPADLKQASRLAHSSEHKAKIEHMAVATLADKSRLIDFTLSPDRTASSSHEGGCWMGCKYNFSLIRPIKGSISVQLNPRSPIKLTQGHYRLVLNAAVFVPRTENRRSNWEGNYDGENNQNSNKQIVIELHPPNYRASVNYELEPASLAFFQRGSAGGYKGVWSIGDPKVTFSYQSMELIQ